MLQFTSTIIKGNSKPEQNATVKQSGWDSCYSLKYVVVHEMYEIYSTGSLCNNTMQ